MVNITSVKRYIDDGCGMYHGSEDMFVDWLYRVNLAILPYGLTIDEHTISDPGNYVPFFDIQFCLDQNGQLQTYLYVKETDARSYLFFGSSHSNHVFLELSILSGCN